MGGIIRKTWCSSFRGCRETRVFLRAAAAAVEREREALLNIGKEKSRRRAQSLLCTSCVWTSEWWCSLPFHTLVPFVQVGELDSCCKLSNILKRDEGSVEIGGKRRRRNNGQSSMTVRGNAIPSVRWASTGTYKEIIKWNEIATFSFPPVCLLRGYRLRVPRDCNGKIFFSIRTGGHLDTLRAVWPPSVTSKSSLWQHTKQCVIVLVPFLLPPSTSMRLLIKREKEIIPSEWLLFSAPRTRKNSFQLLMKTKRRSTWIRKLQVSFFFYSLWQIDIQQSWHNKHLYINCTGGMVVSNSK